MATRLRLHFQVSPAASCGQVTSRHWTLQSEQTYEHLPTACPLQKSTWPLSPFCWLGVGMTVLGMMNINARGT